MAGLACARTLAEAGWSVTVLEASDRVGGRIRSVRDGDVVVELGAEFVHGRPEDLWALIEEAGLETYERTGAFLTREDGEFVAEDDSDDEVLEGLESFAGPDCGFAEYVERVGLSEEEKQAEIGYVEGFNAADAREASVRALGVQQEAEDAIEGDRMWRLVDGYSGLVDFLKDKVEAASGSLLVGAKVLRVEFGAMRTARAGVAKGAKVSVADGRVFEANACVVTVPLGVLQAGVLEFPDEAEDVLQAARRMRMGMVCRFTLVFKERLWPEEMSFVLARESVPGVWWTAHPHESRSLTGWVGGPKAQELLALSAAELRERAMASAAEVLGMNAAALRDGLVGFHTHDWTADEWTRGAYSWVPVGGLDASQAMCEPVADTLYFAGEHTDTTGHWGTVHAAYRSGLRAARQVLDRANTGGEAD